MATETKKGDYGKTGTEAVKPFQAYEKDFTNPGQFEIRNHENQIHLKGYLWPGRYHGERWHRVPPNEESFLVEMHYRNQNNVEIRFSANKILRNYFFESHAFVKKAAEKFFLVNICLKNEGVSSDKMTWKYIEDFITSKMRTLATSDIDQVDSWSKTMTVAEAKELFEYLKLEIQFPS